MISLSQNELEALRILWSESDLKPAEIQARFSWEIDNGTLRSTLVNLVEKGQVTRKQHGKAFQYAASIPKRTMLQTMMQNLARIFAGGSPQELVAQLVETGDIKPSDLKIISETAAGIRKSKRKE